MTDRKIFKSIMGLFSNSERGSEDRYLALVALHVYHGNDSCEECGMSAEESKDRLLTGAFKSRTENRFDVAGDDIETLCKPCFAKKHGCLPYKTYYPDTGETK